jgi:hypothetical protein
MIKMELSGKAVAICNPSPKAISIYNGNAYSQAQRIGTEKI